MADGQDMLVFPGGAHETVKPSSELYTLQWKQRYGFIRMAINHGYTIVPFGLVGPDEFYGHLFEGEQLRESALVKLLTRTGVFNDNTRNDMFPPIPVGTFGSIIPKPKRCFLGFGEPIDLSGLQGKRVSQKRIETLRAQVAGEVEAQLSAQLLLREQSKHDDSLWRRLLSL